MMTPTGCTPQCAWLDRRPAAPDVLIEVSRRPVHRGRRRAAGTGGRRRRLPGLTLPGLANAHSHAFHRALRGRTQAGGGTFWTWRERMYEVADRLDPDTYLALARAVYAEMALAGITCVGEFHYLHHDPGGEPYADPNAMGAALIEAAARGRDPDHPAGHLLPDRRLWTAPPLAGPQQRFGDGDATAWADRVDRAGRRSAGTPASVGAADPLGAGGAGRPAVRRSLAGRSRRARRCTCTCPSSPPRTRPAWRGHGRTPTELLADARRARARAPRRCTPPT